MAEERCSAHAVSLAQVSVCKCMEMSRWSLLSFLMCSSLTVMNSPSASINYSLAEDTVGGITWKQDQVIQGYFLFYLSLSCSLMSAVSLTLCPVLQRLQRMLLMLWISSANQCYGLFKTSYTISRLVIRCGGTRRRL